VFAGQVLTRGEFRVPVPATTDLTRRVFEVAAQSISLANLRCGCSVRQPFLEPHGVQARARCPDVLPRARKGCYGGKRQPQTGSVAIGAG
jgi:hypothetical protein